ncbi:MAG: Gfo/Idh/MocA family oxidoreductase [Chloroherpetonaceae bacterium]|nr:Gfo/Idh/MocA family oxidoreductase [Chthonomonadaceae bacterium]MDW8206525.1 Gfo/Idh/MocA family oxidoreductase [Chloroherpetonaceae bacterium]
MSDSQNASRRSLYTTRRDFLKTTSSMTALMATGNYAFARGSDRIRVGLIGCGGRGTGAAVDCASAAEGVEVVALGDVFKDRAEGCRNALKEQLKERCKVTDDHVFVGLDAYKKVIQSDVNLVILATPPGFRPLHFRAAVEAGKHVFMEKPIAVDAPGVRSVLESGEIATRKGLGVVAGTQRRHQFEYVETIKRIHDGAIGEIVAAQAYWNQGPLWAYERQPGQSDVEWQLRNWPYFTWLSGDHYVEQHIHNLDVINWVMQTHPVRAYGTGGRQVRVEPLYGHIYDHFAVEFEYPNGVLTWSMARQQDNTDARVSERVVGTKGVANPGGSISGPNRYRYDGPRPNPYVQEHTDLIASIRAGKPLNETKQVAESTLTAIMGRMSAYTGKIVTWEEAFNSREKLMPDELSFGPMPVPPVAMPGRTRLV